MLPIVRNSLACDLQHATLTSHDRYFTAISVFSYRYLPLFLSLTNYFVLGSKYTKGKPSANLTRPTVIETSDESSSITSDLSGFENN